MFGVKIFTKISNTCTFDVIIVFVGIFYRILCRFFFRGLILFNSCENLPDSFQSILFFFGSSSMDTKNFTFWILNNCCCDHFAINLSPATNDRVRFFSNCVGSCVRTILVYCRSHLIVSAGLLSIIIRMKCTRRVCPHPKSYEIQTYSNHIFCCEWTYFYSEWMDSVRNEVFCERNKQSANTST